MVYQFMVQKIEREVLTTTILGDSGSAWKFSICKYKGGIIHFQSAQQQSQLTPLVYENLRLTIIRFFLCQLMRKHC